MNKNENSKTQCFRLTFGCENHKFKGGWAEVYADSKQQALAIYAAVNNLAYDYMTQICCDIYDETEWARTSMSQNGTNFGHGCQQAITVHVDMNPTISDVLRKSDLPGNKVN